MRYENFCSVPTQEKKAIKEKEMNFKDHDIELRIINDDALSSTCA